MFRGEGLGFKFFSLIAPFTRKLLAKSVIGRAVLGSFDASRGKALPTPDGFRV